MVAIVEAGATKGMVRIQFPSIPEKKRNLTIRERRCALCELTRYGHLAKEQARRLFYLSAQSKVA